MASTKFLLKTAYLDSRKERGKLMMFMASIILGIAALVAINSFNYNLVKDIDKQSLSLLGADIVISGNHPIPETLAIYTDSLQAEEASQTSLFSMAYMAQNDQSQFVNIKALEGGFPFYGILKASPQSSSETFRTSPAVLVDEGMMLQYDLNVGDSIKIGQRTFAIAGKLQSAFGSAGVGSSFAPAIYMSKEHLASTELVQPGSLVDYEYYYKVDESLNTSDWWDSHNESFRSESMRIETVEGRKQSLNRAFSSLNYFLNLVALVSLLLGCIGVASSVMIYVKSKMASISVFRCLGMSGNQAFLIYFIQIFILGLLGVLLGAALGSAIQMYLPVVLRDFLPYEVQMGFSPKAFVEGVVIGLVVTTLFATAPLLSIRKVSPLRTLRVTDDEDSSFDPLRVLVGFAIILSLFLFLWRVTGSWKDGGGFTIGLLIAFLILIGVTKVIIWSVRKFFPRGWSYVFRQGLSNLYRPNNQTQTLIISIGLGTAILTMLFIIQGLILQNVSSMDAGNQPNMILYGIEKEQKIDIAELTKEFDLPVIQQVPIVTMNLEGWKGRTKKEWMADTSRSASRWAINREARVTFRDSLAPDEKLIKGTYTGSVEQGDSIWVSLSERWANAMDVDLGDELVWNVQGARIKTYVGSFREISFNSMSTRFFILFPTGVLEEAPQFQVLVTKSPDTKTTAKYRSAVVKAFPNVSVVD
ncbi:MAG: putative ABC transport system permease protein, partial [Saprospiraceae bacterium]